MLIANATARLATDVHGSAGDRTDTLFLHAGVNDRRSWAQLIAALGGDDAGRRLVAFDQRGFGETTYQPEPYHPHEDARAVLDAVGVDTAAVVACSFGGWAAVNLALEYPDRVAALLLIAPAVSAAPKYGFDQPPSLAALVARLKAAEQADDLDEVNRIEARIWLDGAEAADGRVGGEARDLFLDSNARALALAANDPGDEPVTIDAWHRLDEISCPTLLVCGTLDIPGLLDRCHDMADAIAGARLEIIDGVAHLPHLEGDERFMALATEFLATV